ncbi:MAG: hypothetical protein J5717_04725 [Lachnospiraceae bacterium]|nr:hypothetical protein [Lachnospiraceae bacterium]
MNKHLQLVIKVVVILAYAVLLYSIFVGQDKRVETVCCAVAALGSLILFKQKKKPAEY